MTEYEIPLNDLHAVVATAPDTLLAEDQLHLSEAGQRACARQVADAIRAQF
jgi:lysophospholipase L1-like esterase